jgi:hypothetical protein
VSVLRYLAFIAGALALLGAVLPGTRVSSARFSATPGPPMPRAGRIGLLVLGLALLGLGLTCGRP